MSTKDLIYKNESYFIVGISMDVHNELGKGFSEIVYGDALELEPRANGVPYEKEVKFDIYYKNQKLKHHYYADFVIENKIILELKAISKLTESHVNQPLNHLAASKLKLGPLINFGEDSLSYKREVL